MFCKIQKRLSNRIGSDNWRVLRGILVVFFFVLLGKVAAVVKEMALAYRFGVGRTIDIYVFVFVLISWVPAVFQSVVQSIVVPLFNRLDSSNREAFFAELVSGAIIFGAVLITAVFVIPDDSYGWLASGFSDDMKSEVIIVARMLSPCAVLLVLISVYSAELLSREKHANTLFEAIPASVLFITVVFWHSLDNPIKPLVFGTLAGLTLQFSALYFTRFKQTGEYLLATTFSHPAWREVSSAVSILLVGTFLMSLVKLIDQHLASGLGEGSVSKLSYALRVLTIGVALGNTVLSRAILPVLSDKHNSRENRLGLTWNWARYTFLVSLALSVLSWYLAPWGVKLLFERGAFSAADTEAVSVVVQFGIFQVPFVMSSMVLVQLFATLGEYKKIAFSSLLAISVKFSTAPIAMSVFGLKGLLLSTSLMYMVTFIYFYSIVSSWKRAASCNPAEKPLDE